VSQFTAPHYVIYADNWLDSMPTVAQIGSYNRFILSFWMSQGRGAVDDADAWTGFSASTRKQVLAEYHAAGIALMVSAFGSTDDPTTAQQDPVATAQQLAAWVKQYDLDGVDVDYEDMGAFNSGTGIVWLISFTTELRAQLPAGQYLISHAPVAPWFTTENVYSQGGYIGINNQVGGLIDFYNVQFYNQGDTDYTTCQTLINQSTSDWPQTSVMEINKFGGVPLNKIVIGKPNDQAAADNGYMDPTTLGQCVALAQAQGWNAGVMFWEWDTVSCAADNTDKKSADRQDAQSNIDAVLA
jgi:chitinase